jgi:hypothetical protein
MKPSTVLNVGSPRVEFSLIAVMHQPPRPVILRASRASGKDLGGGKLAALPDPSGRQGSHQEDRTSEISPI